MEQKKTTYKKSAQTKERIFASAIAIMKEVGYQGATIRGICSRAKVSPATFYSYYESKSDLLQGFFHNSDHYFGNDLYRRLEGKDFYEQYREYVLAYAQLNIDTGLDAMRVLYNPENNWFSDYRPMQATLELILNNGKRKGILPAGIVTDECVSSIFILLRGVCFDWCIYNGCYDLKNVMLEHAELLLRGLIESAQI
ncbi:MAG: TetR/AcrR family transcriptional regulator [Oscillospiraceae bacterium]|nr:TetR/AcrR family transcriptional regulator [Oscillospiraceae bacterium]